MRFLRTICWMCAFLGMLHVSIPARSQSSDTNSQAPSSAPAQPPSSAPLPTSDQPALKPAELDALVAPIALYPDPLLANVLMASTYPLEVVRAERWVNQNKNLKEDALKAAAAIGAAAESTGPAEPSTLIAAPMSSTGGTIRRIDKVRGTTMRTCSRGLVAPIARAPVLPPGKGWGLARRGPMSPIALDAQAARRTLAIARPCTGQRVPGV
jgi:hypothetical protein